MGVRRAVEIAWRESSANAAAFAGAQATGQGRQVYTLGPLIHNPGVLKNLEERGIKILAGGEFPPSPENSTVIIRAHGVSPDIEASLVRQGVRILDATCPHVKLSQTKARSYAEKGYRIFLAGEENHGEISGIRGYVDAVLATNPDSAFPFCYVVGTPEEAEKAAEELLSLEPEAKTVLIAQTTISTGEYRAIGERLRQFFPKLEMLDTICDATARRQEALRELCARVDALIIAGGRDSANTRRLLSLAVELGKPAWLVQSPEDIPPEIAAYKTIGLSAGASTPDSLIVEIEEALRAL